MKKVQLIEKKSEKLRNADEKIKQLLLSDKANQIIKIEVGEKSYLTKLKTLLSQKDSLFYKQYYNELEEGQHLTTEWFFDRDNLFFSTILDFLRTSIVNIDGMQNDLLLLFKEEAQYYGIWGLVNILTEATDVVKIVSFKSSAKYSNCGTHSIEGIQDKDNKGGICVQSPYEICFELNRCHSIKGIIIKGYGENTSSWGASNGANSQISTCNDENGLYESVGTIPSNYSSSPITIMFKKTVTMKFIKFKSTGYLGIGYIDFIKC